MMLKIKIIADTSADVYRETLQPIDFNLTDEEWEALDESKKRKHIQGYLDDMKHIQPFWVLDSVIEIKK